MLSVKHLFQMDSFDAFEFFQASMLQKVHWNVLLHAESLICV